MAIDGLFVPGLIALVIGAIAARRLPLIGLVVVLGLILGLALSRYLLGLARPNLLDTFVLIALVQAGYLASALIPGRGAKAKTKITEYDKDTRAS
ncbi:MAG: hypothetical protein CFE34_14745 [Rhodobacteraceae bacterium PARR1]|nr:MAG: hypothetical protein CFE34_14745 [Rhodobacteraceae bacterium PARR1]